MQNEQNCMTFSHIRQFVRGVGRRLAGSEAPTTTIEETSREDVIRIIDELSRRRTGMSAGQLLSAYRAGTLTLTPNVTELLAYSDLLSPDDPIFFESAPRAAAPEACCALR